MDHIDTLVNRLRKYSQSLVSYKLDADFADACTEAADKLEQMQAENRTLRNELCQQWDGTAKRTSARATGADGGRNMTDYKKLCEDLRNLSHYDCEEAPFGTEKKIHEAANAIEKLQAELRQYENLEEQLSDECALCDEIAELKAENDKMRPFYTTADTHFKLWEKTAMDAYEERNRAKAELEKLQAKLDRVTLERDAAVEDVLDAAITPCTYCKRNPSNGGGCDMKTDTHDMYACWQWRGLKEA